MPYTLNFSDPSKSTNVIVPDMPPGINAVDTSLSLVGRGYPNYGQKYAENFLHLLENFSSPQPPENPIEGQLWYDTSDVNNKVLRIMDGTADAARWPSANGIYQQSSDPTFSTSGLKPGDLWVDTANNQIKIYSAGGWVPVGTPQTGALNGAIPEVIYDVTNQPHFVTKHYINGIVVSVTSSETFTPRTVISGFTSLVPGINLYSSGRLNGTATAATGLSISGSNYASSTFLRKNDLSPTGQIITGKVVFTTPADQIGSRNRDGVLVTVTGNASSDYIQLYKLSNDAVLLNSTAGGKIKLQTVAANSSVPVDTVNIEYGSVGINTATNASSPALDVYGNTRVSGTLTVNSTLTVSTSTIIGGNINVAGVSTLNNNVTISGKLYIQPTSGSAILPLTGSAYDIGSSTAQFRRVYATQVGSTGTTLYGTLNGNASGLAYGSQFKLQGQVTATSFTFSGNGTTATFDTTLTPSAILDQTELTTSTSTISLLVANTGSGSTVLQKISRDNFVAGIIPTGMIMPYTRSTPIPSGWLLCDGSSYLVATYPALASSLQYLGTGAFMYGGTSPNFNVPDLTTATSVIKVVGTEPTNYLNYIIKT